MKNDIKCPVCGKTDIPDYHEEDIKCPCCGSDLSIYRIIDQIPEEEKKKNVWKPISAVAILAAAVLGVLLILQKTPKPAGHSNPQEAALFQLEDSISKLNKQIETSQTVTPASPKGLLYIVRKGDSYWSISRKIYGTGTKAEEIAQSNRRNLNTILEPGDTLIIQ